MILLCALFCPKSFLHLDPSQSVSSLRGPLIVSWLQTGHDGICGFILNDHLDENWGALHVCLSCPHCSGAQQSHDVTNVFPFLRDTRSLLHKRMQTAYLRRAASRRGRHWIRPGHSEIRSHKKCSSLCSVCCRSKPAVGLFAICSCLDWNIGCGALRALYAGRGMKLNICSEIFAR